MFKVLAASVLLCLLAAPSTQAETIYGEQDKLIRGGRAVGTLGADLFGDKVSLYNGTLEFTQTDVSLPGNNALPVAIGRRLVPGMELRLAGMFDDWDLDIPHLHGVFSSSGWTTQWGGVARCSTYGVPPAKSYQGGSWNAEEYWHGNFMYLPGKGSEEILSRAGTNNNNIPTDGNTWPLTTRSMWSLRCIPMAGGVGEGFLAMSPDGTQYQFDAMASRTYPALNKSSPAPEYLIAPGAGGTTAVNRAIMAAKAGAGGITPNLAQGYILSRKEVWLLPTQVTDRHGNWVRYTYGGGYPLGLTAITASDGRTITITYHPTNNSGLNLVASVSDGSRTWTYSYNNGQPPGYMSEGLTSITQPDGAQWRFSMGAFSNSLPLYSGAPMCEDAGDLWGFAEAGSMTHPSGAVGTFQTTGTGHGRSFVEKQCQGNVPDGTSYARFPRFIASRSLTSKTISGPGLPGMAWSYAYSPAANSASWLDCSGSCPDFKTVEVTDPRNVLTRYTFGNRYKVTEGQLQKVEVGPAAAPLRTTTMHYRAPAAGPYPSYIGISPQRRGDADLASRFAPMDQKVTDQQGVNFTWAGSDFDTYARAQSISRTGTPGATRVESTIYNNQTPTWVLGQVERVTENSSGKVMVQNTYAANTGNLLSTAKFGRLDQSFSYNPDGTLATRADGLGRSTTFSNYLRGLARNVLYADGSTESAVVDNRGLITAVTDQNSFTTSYGYDAIGRLNQVTYPADPGISWNPTTLTFESVGSSEYALAAGHWRQTIATGNARTVNYFDALWRPRLSRTFDTLDATNTLSQTLRRFDADGRTTFESYPSRAAISSVDQSLPGTQSTYDALGRTTTRLADSELGVLTTSTYYNPGFQTSQVNPRGYTTTNSFQVFDEPSESAISAISAPEGVSVAIARDVFGKPRSITRSGAGVSATRSYVFDANERLCKTVEPETGATISVLDAANNVSWRAVSPIRVAWRSVFI